MFYGHSVPILSQATVDDALHFDVRLDDWSMRTLLDTLIIDSLPIDSERLRKDHVRDVLVVERFAVQRAWGKSPAQVVLYMESDDRTEKGTMYTYHVRLEVRYVDTGKVETLPERTVEASSYDGARKTAAKAFAHEHPGVKFEVLLGVVGRLVPSER